MSIAWTQARSRDVAEVINFAEYFGEGTRSKTMCGFCADATQIA
jgi:hypothetical protein